MSVLGLDSVAEQCLARLVGSDALPKSGERIADYLDRLKKCITHRNRFGIPQYVYATNCFHVVGAFVAPSSEVGNRQNAVLQAWCENNASAREYVQLYGYWFFNDPEVAMLFKLTFSHMLN